MEANTIKNKEEKNKKDEISEDDYFADLLSQIGQITVKVTSMPVALPKELESVLKGKKMIACPKVTCQGDLIESVLAMIDIVNENEAKGVFYPSVGMITRVGERPDFFFGRNKITKFNIPKIGAEKLTQRILNNAFIFYHDELFGNVDKDNIIFGARFKLDGVQAIVFSIIVGQEEYYYYWDDEIICESPIKKTVTFEKVGSKLYCVSCKACDCKMTSIVIKNKTYEIVDHAYEVLSSDLVKYVSVNRGQMKIDGLIVLINGFEYKCPFERVITLKYDGSVLKSKSGTIVKYDMDGHSPGMYDFAVQGNEYLFRRKRDDKVEGDSDAVIDVIRNNLVIVDELEQWIVMRKKRKIILPDYEVTLKVVETISEKKKLINEMIANSKAGLVYMIRFVSSARDKDFISTMGASFSIERSNRRDSKYYFLAGVTKPKYIRSYGERWVFQGYDVTSEWYPGSVAFFLERRTGIECLVKDVPGFGFKEVVYLKKIGI